MSNFNNGNSGVNANASGPSAAPAGPSGLNNGNNGVNAYVAGPSGLNNGNNGVNANAGGPLVAPAGRPRRHNNRNYRVNARAVPPQIARDVEEMLVDVPVVYENEVNNAVVAVDAPIRPGEVNNAIVVDDAPGEAGQLNNAAMVVDDAPTGQGQLNNAAMVVDDAPIGQGQLNNAIIVAEVPIAAEPLGVAIVAQDPPNNQGAGNPVVNEVHEPPSYWHEFMTSGHEVEVHIEDIAMPLEERIKGWIIRELQCKGKTPEKMREDPNYVHLRSDKICRAWTEVVDYVVRNIAPSRVPRREAVRRPKAHDQFNLFAVGFINMTTRKVYYANNRIAVSNKRNTRIRQIGPVKPGFDYIVYDFEPIQPMG